MKSKAPQRSVLATLEPCRIPPPRPPYALLFFLVLLIFFAGYGMIAFYEQVTK